MKKSIFIIILSTICLTACGNNNNNNATNEFTTTETVTQITTTEDTSSVSSTTTMIETTTTPTSIEETTTVESDTTSDTITEVTTTNSTTESTSESIAETSTVFEETSIEDLPLDDYQNYINNILKQNENNPDFNRLSLIQSTMKDFLKTAVTTQDKDKISNMYKEYMKTITEKNYLESANLENDLNDDLQMVETANKDSLKIIIEGSIGQSIKDDIKSISVETLNTLPEDEKILSENDIRVIIDEAYAKVCSGYANNNVIEIVDKYGVNKEDLS